MRDETPSTTPRRVRELTPLERLIDAAAGPSLPDSDLVCVPQEDLRLVLGRLGGLGLGLACEPSYQDQLAVMAREYHADRLARARAHASRMG